MVRYIVDASVVIEYLITSTHTPEATSFFDQVTSSDQLMVPEFCLLECTNVIWKQVRFFGMTRNKADELLIDLKDLKLRRRPMKNLLDRALDIALAHKLAVYDTPNVKSKRIGHQSQSHVQRGV